MENTSLLHKQKGGDFMNDNSTKKSYFIDRIRLEKTKRKTWRLVVLTKFLFILADLISYYTRQQ